MTELVPHSQVDMTLHADVVDHSNATYRDLAHHEQCGTAVKLFPGRPTRRHRR